MTKPQLSAFAKAARLSAIRSRNGTQVAQRLNINQSPTLKQFTSAELIQIRGSEDYVCREAEIEPTPAEVLHRYAQLGETK